MSNSIFCLPPTKLFALWGHTCILNISKHIELNKINSILGHERVLRTMPQRTGESHWNCLTFLASVVASL
jgi:hypothetical protein